MPRRKLFMTLGIVSILMLALGASIPVAAAPMGPPAGWQAHPPIRFRPQVTRQYVAGLTPAQVLTAYGFDKISGTGTGQTIAIVDAYGSPSIVNDWNAFNTQFFPSGASGTLTVVAPEGTPSTNSGWALETSLDVEWAHAIAPSANILLVEAKSAFNSDLLSAISYATSQNATVVSMSWGGSEFSGESSYDSYFQHLGTTYVASSGDSGAGVEWPAVSPYVVGVGGTTLDTGSGGTYLGETAWSGSGGGQSAYVSEPSYQDNAQSSKMRQVPDVAFDADPNTGVAVYDSTRYQGHSGWWVVGGTSVGAPCWAGLFALTNESGNALLYGLAYPASTSYNGTYFNDIQSGNNGGYTASLGYDMVTGLGTPKADALVPALGGTTGGSTTLASSTTDAVLSASSITLGGTVTDTATVSSSSGVPTGSVQFEYQALGSNAWNNLGSPVTLDSSGIAKSPSFQPSAVGTYYFQAVYSGDTTHNGSTSGPETLTVNSTTSNGSLSVSVSTNKGSYKAGQTGTITVTVTSGGQAISGADVTISVASPIAITTLNPTPTDLSGTASFDFTTSGAHGTYSVDAYVSTTTYGTGSGSTTFKVR